MKQYFLCPKCKKKLIRVGKEQYQCKKCKAIYKVPNYQRISMLVINGIIAISAILSLLIALSRV